jgi:hypothetical protein
MAIKASRRRRPEVRVRCVEGEEEVLGGPKEPAESESPGKGGQYRTKTVGRRRAEGLESSRGVVGASKEDMGNGMLGGGGGDRRGIQLWNGTDR